MKIELHEINLPLRDKFTISRGSLSNQLSLIVELSDQGVSGFGETTANPYYSHTIESLRKTIGNCQNLIEQFQWGTPKDLWKHLKEKLASDSFAISAIDMAAHDLYGKLHNQPTWKTLGLTWERVAHSSFTIGLASLDEMVRKLQDAPDWDIYKVKLGAGNDIEIIRTLRSYTDARFRVDANCGWTVQQTIAFSHSLKELGVEFIEQPLPADASLNDHQRVFREAALPIIADESCLTESDVDRCHEHFHGINVKLCKCGGITPAYRMLSRAKALDMQTMVGCMIESSIGISAAAQLLPLLDYADLDGALLLKNDPAQGVTMNISHLSGWDRPGNGGCCLKMPN